jgi:ribosomally synthesized peptide (two-chain TOMM family)
MDDTFRNNLITGDAIKHIQERFQEEEFPWCNLKLIVRKNTGFYWDGEDWSWPEPQEDTGERLTLYLPIRPKTKIAPEKRARALADYYQERPSLFGNDTSGRSRSLLGDELIVHIGNKKARSVFAEHSLKGNPIRRVRPNPVSTSGFVADSISFLHFEVAVLAILAKAWENDRFASEILNEQEDKQSALKAVRGYTSPWKLELSIKNDREASWNDEGVDPKGDPIPSSWVLPRLHQLELNLPEKPEQVRDQSIALAAYNTTGAEYPFTCCA